MGKNRFPNPFDLRPSTPRKQHVSSQENSSVASAVEKSLRPEADNQLVPVVDKSVEKQSSDLITWIDSLKDRVNSTLQLQLLQSRLLDLLLASEKKQLELRDQIFDEGFEQLQEVPRQQHQLEQVKQEYDQESVEASFLEDSERGLFDNNDDDDVIEVLSSEPEEAYDNLANGLQQYINHTTQDPEVEAEYGDDGMYGQERYEQEDVADATEEIEEDLEEAEEAEEEVEEEVEEEAEEEAEEDLEEAAEYLEEEAEELSGAERSDNQHFLPQNSGKYPQQVFSSNRNRGLHDLHHRSYIHDYEQGASSSIYDYDEAMEQEQEQDNYMSEEANVDDGQRKLDEYYHNGGSDEESIVVLDSEEEAEAEVSESVGETEQDFDERATDEAEEAEESEQDQDTNELEVAKDSEVEEEEIDELQLHVYEEVPTATNDSEENKLLEHDEFYSVDLNAQAQEIANQFYDQLNATTSGKPVETDYSILDAHDLLQLAEVALGTQEQQGYQADYEPTDSKSKDLELSNVDLSPMAPIPLAFDDLSSLSDEAINVEDDGLSEGSLADSEGNKSAVELDETIAISDKENTSAENEHKTVDISAAGTGSEDSFDGNFVFRTIKQEDPEDVLRKLRETEKKFSVKLNVTSELEEQIRSLRAASFQPEDTSLKGVMQQPIKPILEQVELRLDDSFTMIDTTKDEEIDETGDFIEENGQQGDFFNEDVPKEDEIEENSMDIDKDENVEPHVLRVKSDQDDKYSNLVPTTSEVGDIVQISELSTPKEKYKESCSKKSIELLANPDAQVNELINIEQESDQTITKSDHDEVKNDTTDANIAIYLEAELRETSPNQEELNETDIVEELEEIEAQKDGVSHNDELDIEKPQLDPVEETMVTDTDYTFDQTISQEVTTLLEKPILEDIDESMEMDFAQPIEDGFDRIVSEAVDLLNKTSEKAIDALADQDLNDQNSVTQSVQDETPRIIHKYDTLIEERPFSPGLGISITQSSKTNHDGGFEQTLDTLSEDIKEVYPNESEAIKDITDFMSEENESPKSKLNVPSSNAVECTENQTTTNPDGDLEQQTKNGEEREEEEQGKGNSTEDNQDTTTLLTHPESSEDEVITIDEVTEAQVIVDSNEDAGKSNQVTEQDEDESESKLTDLDNELNEQASKESHSSFGEENEELIEPLEDEIRPSNITEGFDDVKDTAVSETDPVGFETPFEDIHKPDLESLPEEEQESEEDDGALEPQVEEPQDKEGIILQYADDTEIELAKEEIIHPSGEAEPWEEPQHGGEFEESFHTYQLEIVSSSSEEGDEASVHPATIEEPVTAEEESFRVIEIDDDEEYPNTKYPNTNGQVELPLIDTPEPETFTTETCAVNYEIIDDDGIVITEVEEKVDTIEIVTDLEGEQDENKAEEKVLLGEHDAEAAESNTQPDPEEDEQNEDELKHASEQTNYEPQISLKRLFANLNDNELSPKVKKQKTSWFGWLRFPFIYTKVKPDVDILEVPDIVVTDDIKTSPSQDAANIIDSAIEDEDNEPSEEEVEDKASGQKMEPIANPTTEEDYLSDSTIKEHNSEISGEEDALIDIMVVSHENQGIEDSNNSKEESILAQVLTKVATEVFKDDEDGDVSIKETGDDKTAFSSESADETRTIERVHSESEPEQETSQPLPKQRRPKRILGLDIDPANLEPRHSLRNGLSYGGQINEEPQVGSPQKPKGRNTKSRRLSLDLSSQTHVRLSSDRSTSRKSSGMLTDDIDHPSSRTRSKSPLKVSMSEILDEDLPISQRIRRSRKRRADGEDETEEHEAKEQKEKSARRSKGPTPRSQNSSTKDDEPRGRSKRRS